MYRRIPRPILAATRHIYDTGAGLLFVLLIVLLNLDGLSWLDGIILVGFIIVAVLLFDRLRPKQSKTVPASPEALLNQLTSSDRFTLIAFESAFCATCMATDPRMAKLEENPPPNLRVMRVIIQNQPGKTLFEKYDLRLTPTYILFDKHGKDLMEWVVALPIERVLYAIKDAPAT